jgi:voltage-gated potassium channel
MYKAIHAILTGKNIARIDEIHVHDHGALVGKNIKDIDFKANKLLFIGIQREGEFMFNPLSSVEIEPYDILLVMGRQISLDYFNTMYTGGLS